MRTGSTKPSAKPSWPARPATASFVTQMEFAPLGPDGDTLPLLSLTNAYTVEAPQPGGVTPATPPRPLNVPFGFQSVFGFERKLNCPTFTNASWVWLGLPIRKNPVSPDSPA